VVRPLSSDAVELNRLIAQALKTNNNLAAATIKVRKARLEAGLEATNRTPDVSVSAGTGTEKGFDSGDRTHSSSTTTSLSWELDLWGKLASSRDAAEWGAKADYFRSPAFLMKIPRKMT
jgi:outer membrane protein TolC